MVEVGLQGQPVNTMNTSSPILFSSNLSQVPKHHVWHPVRRGLNACTGGLSHSSHIPLLSLPAQNSPRLAKYCVAKSPMGSLDNSRHGMARVQGRRRWQEVSAMSSSLEHGHCIEYRDDCDESLELIHQLWSSFYVLILLTHYLYVNNWTELLGAINIGGKLMARGIYFNSLDI